ncbi:PepSY-associated TM helix domain-containing protein [Meiothermus sp. CFH 77666]|uniref:PepSY-associated TM helix domain-containing protein n=1 Tax=Meiothermus sp. CFH 77666 TaxID=2817942 RepID=UPI001FB0F052|nr:PepSY-associated TM helix domain-containing protein [Meiothermus sp. CFH 77666]
MRTIKASHAVAQTRAGQPLRAQAYVWARSIHLYTSMISLVVVLFFAATGITLNHPDWAFGNTQTTHTYQGTLPSAWRPNGQIDWLKTAEFLRSQHSLKGQVQDTTQDAQEASLSFRAPGYAADAFIQLQTGSYTLRVVAQGPVAVLNDLHRGRDAGAAWSWVIDLAGGFLGIVALSGLALSLFLRKTRKAAVLTALVGSGLLLLLMLTTR